MNFVSGAEIAKILNISLAGVKDFVDRETIACIKFPSGQRTKFYIPDTLAHFRLHKHKCNSCKVITVNNLKGGTGKTTVAANLAFSLSLLAKRVLIVDMDPQANMSHYLIGRDNIKNPITNLFQMSLDRKQVSKTDIINSIQTIEHPNSKADLIASSLKLSRTLEQLRHSSSAAITKLDHLLEKVKDDYDFIIIDTPPNVSIIMQMCLFASDMICIVTEAEEFAIEGMTDLVEEIYFVKSEIADLKGIENELEIKALIVNKVENTTIHKDMQTEIFNIATELNTKVYTIPKSTKVKESQSLKLPLLEYRDEVSSGGKALESILELAFDILEKKDG